MSLNFVGLLLNADAPSATAQLVAMEARFPGERDAP